MRFQPPLRGLGLSVPVMLSRIRASTPDRASLTARAACENLSPKPASQAVRLATRAGEAEARDRWQTSAWTAAWTEEASPYSCAAASQKPDTSLLRHFEQSPYGRPSQGTRKSEFGLVYREAARPRSKLPGCPGSAAGRHRGTGHPPGADRTQCRTHQPDHVSSHANSSTCLSADRRHPGLLREPAADTPAFRQRQALLVSGISSCRQAIPSAEADTSAPNPPWPRPGGYAHRDSRHVSRW